MIPLSKIGQKKFPLSMLIMRIGITVAHDTTNILNPIRFPITDIPAALGVYNYNMSEILKFEDSRVSYALPSCPNKNLTIRVLIQDFHLSILLRRFNFKSQTSTNQTASTSCIIKYIY